MNVLQTPDARFQDLPDYSFSPNYVKVDGLRMHYVDEGMDDQNTDQKTVLMMHGEPSWSYLYRHMIPVCVKAGHRVIAPDLIGFGKSDKPTDKSIFTYQKHMDWVTEFLTALNLKNIVLVCQDWGSLLGLRLAAEQENRFDAIVLSNGGLPVGGERKAPLVFQVWQIFAKYSPWFPISKIVNAGSFKNLSADELRAYDAPFPNSKYKKAARAFPSLVPTKSNNPANTANKAAWKILENWEKPFVTAFSNGDPITKGFDKGFHESVPGTKGMPHKTLKGGHFSQEDAGAEFAELVNHVIKDYL